MSKGQKRFSLLAKSRGPRRKLELLGEMLTDKEIEVVVAYLWGFRERMTALEIVEEAIRIRCVAFSPLLQENL